MSDAAAHLDPAVCERARLTRDARFDGRFFVAVRTTKIFCRPICPVRLPRPENVTFYPSAAAASEHGYRPCLRCRPELAPDHPWWPLQAPLVREALQRIGDGRVDQDGVAGLAATLGVSDRHLRRLFLQHVGASPKSVAQSRRVLLAKQLVTDSALPLQQIAQAAGFGSTRRFNAAFQKHYGQPPSALRRKPVTGSDGFSLKLAYRPPYNWPQVREFLATRAIAGVEVVGENHYQRSFLWQGQAGLLELRHHAAKNAFELRVDHPQAAALYSASAGARRLLDLDAAPDAIAEQLGRDPLLASIQQRHPGLRLPAGWDRFEICVRAVVGQQITVAAANTILGRIVARCAEHSADLPDGWLLFPRPETLATVNLDDLGLTGRRIATLQQLSAAVAAGDIRLDSEDSQALDAALASIRGIGPWTRAYIAMRGLGQPDALPAEDIVLRRALSTDPQPLHPDALRQRAASWRPWRAYAVMHVWHAAARGELK